MVHRQRPVYRTVSEDGKTEMTITEFTNFLHKFDADNDGLISREELRQALKHNGSWFATWKANRLVKAADANGNGFIDKDEISKLAEFAEKELNIRIVAEYVPQPFHN